MGTAGFDKRFLKGIAAVAVLCASGTYGWARDPSPIAYPGEERSHFTRAWMWLDHYFRVLEFREPIVAIPVEARYGIGFYGWRRGNPFQFDSTLISYEGDPPEIIGDIDVAGRTASFIEMQGLQTNLSYLLFGKSYLDVLTGLGFRYSSVFGLPNLPEVPTAWFREGTQDTVKTFSPTVFEGNIVTSFVLQWRPFWFVHFQYSYGYNHVRFYRDDSVNPDPSGTGRTSTYSLGIKFIRETETAARYAWGFELRHAYQRVETIRGEDTPISSLSLPNLGIFFTFGAFYGGRPTVGDEGKALFLKKDYVAAKRKFTQFVNTYPHHARVGRARKLLSLSTQRIPYQLVNEGEQLERRGNLDLALDKFIQAKLAAGSDLKPQISRIIERVAEKYMGRADSLFALRQDEPALKAMRKAGSVSEGAKESGLVLEARIYLEQGRDLAFRELYPMALEKYDQAMKLAPSLKIEIHRARLEAAAGMLEDVNRASDEASVRLGLQSLYRAREILGRSDPEMDRIISGLESQLTRLDQWRIHQRIGDYVAQADQERARRDIPRVTTGMLVAEVEYILGEPDTVVERLNERNRNTQLWIYNLPDGSKRSLYFEDYVLFRIEQE